MKKVLNINNKKQILDVIKDAWHPVASINGDEVVLIVEKSAEISIQFTQNTYDRDINITFTTNVNFSVDKKQFLALPSIEDTADLYDRSKKNFFMKRNTQPKFTINKNQNIYESEMYSQLLVIKKSYLPTLISHAAFADYYAYEIPKLLKKKINNGNNITKAYSISSAYQIAVLTRNKPKIEEYAQLINYEKDSETIEDFKALKEKGYLQLT